MKFEILIFGTFAFLAIAVLALMIVVVGVPFGMRTGLAIPIAVYFFAVIFPGGMNLWIAATGDSLYLLDEPTTGLHFEDIRKLMQVLNALADNGNSVVVIEHNLDVIKCADWVIDMGPEAGKEGGQVVFAGPAETLVRYANDVSYTIPMASGASKKTLQKATKKSQSAAMLLAEKPVATNKLRSYTGEALKAVLETTRK